MPAPKRGLGKGLSALIPAKRNEAPPHPEGVERLLKISDIKPNRFQPRRIFREEQLAELMRSIKEKGVIQPVIVRRAGQGYELIAGERRLRASQRLGLERIPALVRQVSDQESLEIAIVENLQREDLNPLEEARGYQELAQKFGLTQEQVAQKVGRDRSTVANSLRLLTLPGEIQQMIESGRLSAGHARALLSVSDRRRQLSLAQLIAAKGLSVREAEALARGEGPAKGGRREARPNRPLDQHLANIQNEIQRALGTRVRLVPQGKAKGKIEVEYYSAGDLERILGKLNIKL